MFIPNDINNPTKRIRLLKNKSVEAGIFTSGHEFRVLFYGRPTGRYQHPIIKLIDSEGNKLNLDVNDKFQEGVHFEFF